MAPSRLMERNVRPRRVNEELDDALAPNEELEGSELEDASDEGEDGLSSEDDENDDGSVDAGDMEGDDSDVEPQITNVSFGALKQAQDAFSRKRKRGSEVTEDQDDKLEALRKRLRQIKEEKASNPENGRKSHSTATTLAIAGRARVGERDDAESDEEDDDSDSAPSEEDAPTKSRASKHAPTAQSSRHQVTRKRTVVDVPKRIVRDPRFDSMHQHSADPGNSEKAYSFLRDYQKSEIDELKAAIKRTKSEDDKATLRRKVNSMENRIKSKEAQERQQEVLRKFRKEEKGKVEQGKTPFYLKKKELKERALVEKFKGMKGKEREKVVEKRRLKESQKEKRRMPGARRRAG